jgi:hypothetical protein
MNLICFPHYTCGGLLCDILNGTFSAVASDMGIGSREHGMAKIGDCTTVFDRYDPEKLLSRINQLQQTVNDNTWVGTHCWPGLIDTSVLNQVIVVTTTTYRSKLYRWIRAYYHYYEKSDPWLAVSGQARIDKERETAKSYLVPFLPVDNKNIINIEFAEIVETSTEFLKLINGLDIAHHMDRWKLINHFLYDNVWLDASARRFHEAELETILGRYYVYE